MTLRQRTLLMVGIAVFALNAVLYAIAANLMWRNVQQAEAQDTRKQLNGVITVFNQSLEQFNRNFSDWAIWDDAYAFVENGDQKFVQSNLITGQLATNQINLIAFIQPSGRITFGTGFDLKTQKKTPIPAELRRRLVPTDRLLQHPTLTHTLSGIISLPEGNMMIISRPILKSDGQGPIRGTLVVGRYLDQAEVARLAKITRLQLDIQSVATAQLPAHLQSWRNVEQSEQSPLGMQALNANTIAGYALFQDIYGQPALVLRTDSDRTIYRQGQTTLRFLAGSMLGTSVVFCMATLLFLEKLVLSRLTKLSKEVGAISRDNLSSRVSELGQDELSGLAVGINAMLADLAAYEQSRQQAVMAVEQSERKFRNLFENSQVGIFRVRMADSMILDANQQFMAMAGYGATPMIGQKRTTELYLYPEDRERAREQLYYFGELHNFEAQFRKQDGSTFWGLFSARLDQASGCVDGVIADISDRKAAETELRHTVAVAEAANRAKSVFLSNMSHELRTPLNVILGFSQLLLRGGSLNAQQQEYLDTINRGGEHLLTLINDVLEMSKIEAGRVTLTPIDVDLYKLLDWVRQMFHMKAQSKGLQLRLDRAPDLPQLIHTDESKLRQVLVNLVGNAVKFTQDGAIALRVKQVTNQPLTLQFEVEDTGMGIAPEDLSHLFQPFVQTESGQKTQEGTGLGLAISQKFVQLMGGEITVSSTIGMGTLFRFTIVTAIATAPPQLAVTTHAKVVGLAPDQPSYRILIVEDKAENRQVLRELLVSVGFEVQEAVNGLGAIELVERWQPDLIWMDIRMPVMDGYEATQRIRAASEQQQRPAPIIIAVTGSVFEEDRKVAIEMGCSDFVRKPFQVSLIFEKMAEFLGVRYRYAEPESNLPAAAVSQLPLAIDFLTVTDLSGMPADWLNELRQAASRANKKQLLNLIAQMPPAQAHVATALTQLVNDFCFEEIVALAT
jgi:PAS domain S-box-containing protein